MSLGEFTSGVRFQVIVETGGLLTIGKCMSRIDPPWNEIFCMRDFPAIMFRETLLKVLIQSDIASAWMANTF